MGTKKFRSHILGSRASTSSATMTPDPPSTVMKVNAGLVHIYSRCSRLGWGYVRLLMHPEAPAVPVRGANHTFYIETHVQVKKVASAMGAIRAKPRIEVPFPPTVPFGTIKSPGS